MRYLLLYIFVTFSLAAQTPWADSVVSYSFGTNTDFGQDLPYFPANVTGMPDTSARFNAPSAIPEEICALGFGGEIILKFSDNVIKNGQGADFIVFENAFEIQYGQRAGEIFAEPAKVAVSQDGIIFYEFPYDSTTLEGCAGITPTYGGEEFLDPELSGGNSFDLDDVQLDSALYVKITDISRFVQQDPNHLYFDFTINGFDLDAVVAVPHIDTISTVNSNKPFNAANQSLQILSGNPNPVELASGNRHTVKFVLQKPSEVKVEVYNILGQKLITEPSRFFNAGVNYFNTELRGISSGTYFIRLSSKYSTAIHKVLLVK